MLEYKKPIGESTNRALVRNFRIYLAVGGMPQAVEAYVKKRNFAEIDRIKREIIDLYCDDLKKIDPSGRLSSIFSSIPAQLVAGKRNFSFRAGKIKGKATKDEERIYDLVDSRMVNICYRVFEPSLALDQGIELGKFKLYLLDTGLFVTMLCNNGTKTYEGIYSKLLSNDLNLNLGYLYENAVAQALVAEKKRLYYHTWAKEGTNRAYEIDILCAQGGRLVPLEVKSNRIDAHASIDAFELKYPKVCGQRYLVSSKDYRRIGNLVNIPYYLLPFKIRG